MVNLRELVRRQPAPPKIVLPFTHTTKPRTVRDILKQTPPALRRSICAPFVDPFVFVFYGRPAYRIERSPGERKGSRANPVCFLLRTASLGAPKGIFVFDTGGYPFYKAQKRDLISMEKFALAPDISEPAKFAYLIFGGEKNYLVGKPPSAALKSGFKNCSAAMQYLGLMDVVSRSDVDDRGFTVEIHYDLDLPISSTTVEAIILPRGLLDMVIDGRSLETRLWSDLHLAPNKILAYESWRGLSPGEHHGIVMELMLRYFESSK